LASTKRNCPGGASPLFPRLTQSYSFNKEGPDRISSKYGLLYTEEEDRALCQFLVKHGVHGQWVRKEWFETNVEGQLPELRGRVGFSLYSRYTSHIQQQLSEHLKQAQSGDFSWIKVTPNRFKSRMYSYEEDWALCEVVFRNGFAGRKVVQKWFQCNVVESNSPAVLRERSAGSLYGRFNGTLVYSLDADCATSRDGKPRYLWLRRLHGMPDGYQPDVFGIEIPIARVAAGAVAVQSGRRRRSSTSEYEAFAVGNPIKKGPEELGVGKRRRKQKHMHDPYVYYDYGGGHRDKASNTKSIAKKKKARMGRTSRTSRRTAEEVMSMQKGERRQEIHVDIKSAIACKPPCDSLDLLAMVAEEARS